MIKLGLDKSLINKYLAGVTNARQRKLTILAKALDINEVWLMGYDVPMDRNLDENEENTNLKTNVRGDSMSPEYQNGDILILEKVENIKDGDDVVVSIAGNDSILRRIFKNKNGIILQPINPAYAPLSYSNKDIKDKHIYIIGKVIELRRKKNV